MNSVKGFIKNKGRDCKCCGLWKVYCNEREKQLMFDKLKKCTKIYLQVFDCVLWHSGIKTTKVYKLYPT